MKTIIATTDYSSDAYYAVHYAARLASRFSAKLLLFNAFQFSTHASNALITTSAVDHIIQNNQKRIAELGRELVKTYHIEVKCLSYLSFVEEELDKLVEQYHADLVVMGMQNKYTENKILGNTTTSVIRKATYPVLVVPFGAEYKNVERILFARDEKALYEEDKSMKLLKEIANGFKAEIEVLHIEKMPAKHLAEENEELKEDELEQVLNGTQHTYKMTNASKIAESIIGEMHAYKPDLLVMIPHQGTFMDHLLKRSITRKMVMETQIPLLALPDLRKREVVHS